jgi:hypothetical protein
MAAFKQPGNQPEAHVAGASDYEQVAGMGRHYFRYVSARAFGLSFFGNSFARAETRSSSFATTLKN